MKTKKQTLITGIILVTILGIPYLHATEKTPVDWEKVAELPGVQRVQIDENGTLKSFVVTGTSRISKALGITKGKQIAQRRALLQAKAEIIRWLNEKLVAVENFGEESVLTISNDGEKPSEQGKTAEFSQQQISSFAEGLVKGTTPIYTEIRSIQDEQELVIVLGWSAQNVRMTNQAQKIMTTEPKSPQTTQQKNIESNASSSTKKKLPPPSTMLPEKKIVSDEATEF